MGKIKEFAEMDGYTETQLLMCEKEDLIEYIKYLRAVTTEKECEMLEIDEEYLEQCVANLVECSE